MPGMRMRAAITGAVVALVGVVAAPAAAAADDGLQRVVDRLGELAPLFDSYPDSVMPISVYRLDTGESASYLGTERFGPASSVKAVWVLAAIEHAGLDVVEPIEASAIYASNDVAAGTAIDMAGGLDAINEYVRTFGMNDTDFYEWNYPREHIRRSSTFPGPARGRNLTTTDDMVTFWRAVAEGQVLDAAERETFLEWTQGLKASSDANRIVARLPDEVGAASYFKSGWLPVPRNWQLPDTEDGPGEIIVIEARGVSVGAGIIVVPDGPSYVLAVAAYDGRSWQGMTMWTEYVSCVVFTAVTGEPLRCSRSRDPRQIALNATPPAGELLSASTRGGLLIVDGWAADPDSWMAATLVRITVDGDAFGGVVGAVPRDVAHLDRPTFHWLMPGELAPGSHEVCAAALDDGGGEPVALGCIAVDVGV